MADRYYAMAETMNTRGAMEMAVPFYRQAIALLLAERETLQQTLGGVDAQPLAEAPTLNELQGLLEAAEALGKPAVEDPMVAGEPAAEPEEPTLEDPMVAGEPAAEPEEPTLEDQIAELASELGADNAMQVMAGLKALAERAGGSLPARGLELLGKTQMLLGQSADGLQSFEAALTAAPGEIDLQINTGAARLSTGDVEGALVLLRGVWQQGMDGLEPAHQKALLRNLSAAEAKAGHVAAAMQLRLKWFQRDSKAVPLQRWLNWVQQGLNGTEKLSPLRDAALALLQALQQAFPTDRTILQLLADSLEDQGDYRDAALLYRQLLRPTTFNNGDLHDE